MYEKGLTFLIRANEVHGTDDSNALTESSTPAVPSTVFFQHECRRTCTDTRKIDLTSETRYFQCVLCLLCGEQAVSDHRQQERVICQLSYIQLASSTKSCASKPMIGIR